ncbi:MAG TPA: aminoglycoside phosphotransferase family protein, partial [Actinopolymorphaceae bacterium]
MWSAGGRSRELATAIAERYQIPADDVVPAPVQGAVNDVWFLGDGLVARIPRGGGAPWAELEKEAAVIPIARRVGVRTPAVVTYDKSCTVVSVPYLVVERVHARDLAALNVGPRAAAGVYRSVGRSLAALHSARRSTVGSLTGVVTDEGGDPREVVERLAIDGYLDVQQARWLAGWFTALERRRPVDVEPVLIHGDVAPQNILVDRESRDLAALVDWGDAAWADPAVDFAKVPLRAVPYVLEGYRSVRDDGTDWEARAL